MYRTLAANLFGADNVRCVRHVTVLLRQEKLSGTVRTATTQNGTSRTRRTSSEKLSGTERTAATQNGTSRTRRTSSAPERLAARVRCTRVRCTHFSSPFINFRHGPKDEKWQKPIRNVMLWYMLWFNFILGSNVIFLCFKLIFIHNHTPKQR